jgi:hypothetical protein
MPRYKPEELFKQKLSQIEKEKNEAIAKKSAQKYEQINAQTSVQNNEQQIAQLPEQHNAQEPVRTVEQEFEQHNSYETVSVYNNHTNLEDSLSKITQASLDEDENNDLKTKLQKLINKIPVIDIQNELLRDRTILPRTSYTLSDELVEMINASYLALKKKDKRVSKQDTAEILLRQLFKDCFKVNKNNSKKN